MNNPDESDDDKPFDASQHKLDEARKRGEVPRSTDMTAAAGYAGLLFAALATGPAAMTGIGSAGMTLLDQADQLSPAMAAGGTSLTGGMLVAFLAPVAPLFLVPMATALLSVLAQRALIFSPTKLAPKLSRISPLANARQKFGADGLFTFAKNTVKMVIVAALLGLYLSQRAEVVLGSLWLTPATASALMLRLMVEFMALVLALSVAFGGIDYGWQWLQHRKRNRMSRKELTDEMKDAEGDPHMKAQRRQRGVDIATNRMLQDVAKADVVIVNPTHYAVALRWSRADRSAPVCVAKGVDAMAARIRERAAEHGVPLHSDPPTARALHAAVEIGQQIRPEHYRAVAAAIRFAEAMRKKARRRIIR